MQLSQTLDSRTLVLSTPSAEQVRELLHLQQYSPDNLIEGKVKSGAWLAPVVVKQLTPLLADRSNLTLHEEIVRTLEILNTSSETSQDIYPALAKFLLSDPHEQVSIRVIKALMSENGSHTLLDLLQDSRLNWPQRLTIDAVLVQHPSPDPRLLIATLKAETFLGLMQPKIEKHLAAQPESFEAILRESPESNGSLHRVAGSLAAKLPDQRLPILIALASGRSASRERTFAISALGESGSAIAAESLCDLLIECSERRSQPLPRVNVQSEVSMGTEPKSLFSFAIDLLSSARKLLRREREDSSPLTNATAHSLTTDDFDHIKHITQIASALLKLGSPQYALSESGVMREECQAPESVLAVLGSKAIPALYKAFCSLHPQHDADAKYTLRSSTAELVAQLLCNRDPIPVLAQIDSYFPSEGCTSSHADSPHEINFKHSLINGLKSCYWNLRNEEKLHGHSHDEFELISPTSHYPMDFLEKRLSELKPLISKIVFAPSEGDQLLIARLELALTGVGEKQRIADMACFWLAQSREEWVCRTALMALKFSENTGALQNWIKNLLLPNCGYPFQVVSEAIDMSDEALPKDIIETTLKHLYKEDRSSHIRILAATRLGSSFPLAVFASDEQPKSLSE